MYAGLAQKTPPPTPITCRGPGCDLRLDVLYGWSTPLPTAASTAGTTTTAMAESTRPTLSLPVLAILGILGFVFLRGGR